MISLRQIISGSAAPIFAIFTPNESVLGVDGRSEIFFNISRDVAMATNFVSYQTCSPLEPKYLRIRSNISRHTGLILATFSPYETALRADDGSVPHFPIFQGKLPWQPNNVAKTRKCYQCRLIPLAFVALEC